MLPGRFLPRRSSPTLAGGIVFAICGAATLALAHLQATRSAVVPTVLLLAGLAAAAAMAFLTQWLLRHRARLRESEHRLAFLADVSAAIDRSPDVEVLVVRVVRVVREAFGADRAWLVYPCEPESPTYSVRFVATAPGWEIDPTQGMEFTTTPHIAEGMRELLATTGAVKHGVDRALPSDPSRQERFRIQSLLSIALRPRAGLPWILGLHQCTHARRWSGAERQLLRDISLRLADALTQRSLLQDRFRALAESTGDVIWETDPELLFRYVSPQCLTVFGRPPEEVVGTSPFDFMREEDAVRAREVAAGIRDAREPFTRRVRRIERPDGKWVLVETTGLPFFDETGKLAGYRGIDRDITERRELEEQLRQAQRMDALGTLAGGIAHDFNNILMVVLGNAQLATQKLPPDDDTRENVEQILIAGNRGKRLVHQILDFTRSSGRRVGPVEIRRIVDEALEFLRATLPVGIAIRPEIGPEEVVVLADPTQISQIVMNLCTNAAHAMGDSGTLTVRLGEADPSVPPTMRVLPAPAGPAALLVVEDTGQGIDPHVLPRIFDPFFTTKEVGKGTGMGLAAVYGILSEIGGGIDVTTTPDQGTAFSVSLPLAAGGRPAKADSPATGTRWSGLALLVDSDPSVLRVGGKMLETLGFEVTTAETSAAALQHFLANPQHFRIVITARDLPDLPGEQLVQRIRTVRTFVPIVMSTGLPDASTREQAQPTGIDAVLPKPFLLEELEAAVRTAVEAQPVT